MTRDRGRCCWHQLSGLLFLEAEFTGLNGLGFGLVIRYDERWLSVTILTRRPHD